MKKYLVIQNNQSDKFWEIEVNGKEHTIRYGKIGTNGTTINNEFIDNTTALKDAQRLLKAKINKGYTVSKPITRKPVKTNTTTKNQPKLPTQSTDIDEWSDIGIEFKRLSAKKVRELLANGFNVNTRRKGRTLLFDILYDDYKGKKKTNAIAHLLIEAGSPLDGQGYQTLVEQAVYLRFLDLIEILIDKGAEVDFDKLLVSALNNTHMSDDRPNYNETIKFFLDRGANPNHENLMWALMHRGNITTLENFFEAGLDLNVIDEAGNTAMHIIIEDWSFSSRGKEDIKAKIRFLLKHKPDLNIANIKQETAMHLAGSKIDNTIIFKELVEAEGNLLAENAEGKTVLDLVKGRRSFRRLDAEFIAYLEEQAKTMTYDKVSWSWEVEEWKIMTPEKVEILVEKGAPMTAENKVALVGAAVTELMPGRTHTFKTEATLLTMAIAYSSVEVVKALFDNNFPFNAEKGLLGSYFNDCWLNRRFDVAEYLVSKGVKIEASTRTVTPLLYMVQPNLPYVGVPNAFHAGKYDLSIDWIKLYAENGAKLDEFLSHQYLVQNVPFEYSDDTEFLIELIDLIDVLIVDFQGRCVLDILKKRNFLNSEKLKCKVIEASKKNTIVDTLRNGKPNEIKALFTKDFTPNTIIYPQQEMTVFYVISAYNPNPEAIDVCVEAGGEFYIIDDDYPFGFDTFSQAARHNSNPAVLQKLIDLGDDPQRIYNDKSALAFACEFNPHLSVIQFLLDMETYDINKIIVNNEVRSPFMLAVTNNANPAIIKLLLDNKAKKKISTRKRGGYKAEAEKLIQENPYLNDNKQIIALLKSPTVKKKVVKNTKPKTTKSTTKTSPKNSDKKETTKISSKKLAIKVSQRKPDTTPRIENKTNIYHYRSDYARTAYNPTDVETLDVVFMKKLPFKFKYITPISGNHVLLSGSYGGVALFNIEQQEILWQYNKEYWSNKRPIVYNEMVCVPTGRSMHLFDIATGEIVKRIGASGGDTSPILYDDKIYLFGQANMIVVDLVSRKRIKKVQYLGKMGRTGQEPIFQENKFWIFTQKRKKKYLEGIALEGESVQFELPKLIQIDNWEYIGGLYYKGAIYFHTQCGKVLGIDTQNGEIIMNIDLLEKYEITGSHWSSLRCTEPALLDNKFIIYSSLINKKTGIFHIDLDKQSVEYTLNILPLAIPQVKQIMVGEKSVYAISCWYDIIKSENGEIVDWIKLKEQEKYGIGINSIEEEFVLMNENLYAVFDHKQEEDGDYSYYNGIVCVGKTTTPVHNVYTRMDMKVEKAKEMRSAAYDEPNSTKKMQLINKGLALDAKNVHLYNDRGNLYRQLNKKDKALADFNKALELDDNYGYAYFNRAFLNIEVFGKPIKETYVDLEKAVASRVRYLGGYITYAEYLMVDNEYKKAFSVLEILREIYKKRGIEDATSNVWTIYLECMCLYMLAKDNTDKENELKHLLTEDIDLRGWTFEPIMNWYNSEAVTKEQHDYLQKITMLVIGE